MIAPSSTFRKWFSHASEKLDQFKKKYYSPLFRKR